MQDTLMHAKRTGIRMGEPTRRNSPEKTERLIFVLGA